jgi:hypothetical protein
VEEVDEGDALGPGDVGHRAGVELEARIVLRTIVIVGVPEVLVSDRREEHEARRGGAVVLLAERVLDEVLQIRTPHSRNGDPRIRRGSIHDLVRAPRSVGDLYRA